MTAEATIPDAVIPAKARNQFDALSSRHSRVGGNPGSFARYAGYKNSGVEWLGEVPAHWEAGRLRWLSQRYAGGTPSKDREDFWSDGTIPWLNSGAVNDALITEPSAYITQEAFDNSSAKWIPEGALVMALAGQGKTKGTVAQVGFRTTCNQSMAAIVPADGVAPRFLFWWLQSNYQNIRNMGGGDLRDGLNLELLGDIPCPMCDQREQEAIAAFLDRETTKIDALIAEQEKLIALLKEKRQALISHAVTKGLDPDAPMKDSGIEWLGQVPAHWEVCQMRRFLACKLTNGIFKRKEEFGDGTLLINVFDAYRPDFKVDFITLDRVRCDANEQSVYAVEDGDVLFVRSSLKVEGIAVAVLVERPPEKAVFECHLIKARLRVERVLPRFASFLFSSSRYRDRLVSLAKVTTMTTIEQESLASLPIVLPPLIEQVEIAAKLDQEVGTFDMLAESAQHTIELLKERRAALISAAVTGKIDVRDKAASNKQGEARAVAGLMSHGA